MEFREIINLGKIAVAFAVALYGDAAPVLQVLIVFAALDMASGMLAGLACRSLSSDVSFRGVAKKGLMFLIVGMAYQLGDVLGLAAAGFYTAHEGLSILENVGRAGLPIPETLREALVKIPTTPPAVVTVEVETPLTKVTASAETKGSPTVVTTEPEGALITVKAPAGATPDKETP